MNEEKKRSQIQQVFKALKTRPKTTKMIQKQTGIPREHITRYIARLEKRKKVTTVERKPCEITGCTAKYYSTDEAYFPDETQSQLFPPKTKSKIYEL
ncbi:hypothetical protein [Fodinibius sp. Rm-B-1B1-1]|uniref:hypothetical protein n=1 Tax=Fodinibius alkaliphilus TaxID=3140241 RepID=UPI00315AF632